MVERETFKCDQRHGEACRSAHKQSFEALKAWFQMGKQPKYVDETSWKIHGERTHLIGSLNASATLYQGSQQRKAEDVKRLSVRI